MNIWETLGIAATKDKKKIQTAYAALLKQAHPEEHPQAFVELQKAYRGAMAYAKGTRKPRAVEYTAQDLFGAPSAAGEQQETPEQAAPPPPLAPYGCAADVPPVSAQSGTQRVAAATNAQAEQSDKQTVPSATAALRAGTTLPPTAQELPAPPERAPAPSPIPATYEPPHPWGAQPQAAQDTRSAGEASIDFDRILQAQHRDETEHEAREIDRVLEKIQACKTLAQALEILDSAQTHGLWQQQRFLGSLYQSLPQKKIKRSSVEATAALLKQLATVGALDPRNPIFPELLVALRARQQQRAVRKLWAGIAIVVACALLIFAGIRQLQTAQEARKRAEMLTPAFLESELKSDYERYGSEEATRLELSVAEPTTQSVSVGPQTRDVLAYEVTVLSGSPVKHFTVWQTFTELYDRYPWKMDNYRRSLLELYLPDSGIAYRYAENDLRDLWSLPTLLYETQEITAREFVDRLDALYAQTSEFPGGTSLDCQIAVEKGGVLIGTSTANMEWDGTFDADALFLALAPYENGKEDLSSDPQERARQLEEELEEIRRKANEWAATLSEAKR